MNDFEKAAETLYNDRGGNVSGICSFTDLTDLSKWEESYNCDDFEFLPYRTDSFSKYTAALFRSYNDTAVEDGITQSVYLTAAGNYILSANMHILEEGIQSGVHGVTAGIRLRICSKHQILAQSNLLTQAKTTAHVRLPFITKANETIQVEIRINGRGAAIVDAVQIMPAKASSSTHNNEFRRKL